MKLHHALPILALLAAMNAPAWAGEDITDIFCADMSEESLYDKNGFESYKMLVPGEDGWIYRSEMDFKQDFSLTPEASHNLRILNDILREKGTKLVFLMQPTRGMMHGAYIPSDAREEYGFDEEKAWKNYWRAIKDMRGEGILAIGIKKVEEGQPFFYKRDHHWNQAGSAIGARVVSDYIKTLPEYESIEKVGFTPGKGPDMEFVGVSKKVFRKLCGTDQPGEAIMERYTERAETVSGDDTLFGEPKAPEIVLAGTSNSTQIPSYANFEGFLKENLSADVLNMSESGGGLDTALLSYFKSDYYKQDPASILIWEAPAYYDISNHMNFFREAVPAAYGICDAPVAEAKDVALGEKNVVVLSRLDDKGIAGGQYFLHLLFSRPVGQPFAARFNYQKDRDYYRFSPEGVYPREFFVSLDEHKESTLNKVVLSVAQGDQEGSVSARICKLPVTVASYDGPREEKTDKSKAASSVRGLLDKFKKL